MTPPPSGDPTAPQGPSPHRRDPHHTAGTPTSPHADPVPLLRDPTRHGDGMGLRGSGERTRWPSLLQPTSYGGEFRDSHRCWSGRAAGLCAGAPPPCPPSPPPRRPAPISHVLRHRRSSSWRVPSGTRSEQSTTTSSTSGSSLLVTPRGTPYHDIMGPTALVHNCSSSRQPGRPTMPALVCRIPFAGFFAISILAAMTTFVCPRRTHAVACPALVQYSPLARRVLPADKPPLVSSV